MQVGNHVVSFLLPNSMPSPTAASLSFYWWHLLVVIIVQLAFILAEVPAAQSGQHVVESQPCLRTHWSFREASTLAKWETCWAAATMSNCWATSKKGGNLAVWWCWIGSRLELPLGQRAFCQQKDTLDTTQSLYLLVVFWKAPNYGKGAKGKKLVSFPGIHATRMAPPLTFQLFWILTSRKLI